MPVPAQVSAIVLAQVKKSFPRLVKLVMEQALDPKVWEALKNLLVVLPGGRLRSVVDATVDLTMTVAEQATTDQERVRAEGWHSRALALRTRLALPMVDKKAHRAAIKSDLRSLHQEIDEALSRPSGGAPS